MKPSSLGRAVSVAPDSRTGPPASSSSEWAMSLHRISCHGRTAALSAMMLAAVPVNANSTSACGESKTARRRSVARQVTGSVPYDGARPSLAAAMAASAVGCAGAALSEANAADTAAGTSVMMSPDR